MLLAFEFPLLLATQQKPTGYKSAALEALDKTMQESLVVGRNEQLAKRLHDIMKNNPKKSLFFAVGVGEFQSTFLSTGILNRSGSFFAKIAIGCNFGVFF